MYEQMQVCTYLGETFVPGTGMWYDRARLEST